MKIICSECGKEVDVESAQQFGSDISIRIVPCDCITNSKLQEFVDEIIHLVEKYEN